jgi:hypothetical protein
VLVSEGSHDVVLSASCGSWVLGSSGFIGFLSFFWVGLVVLVFTACVLKGILYFF